MKSALVFGGARGIGRVVAGAFISDGFGVSVAARTGEQVEATVKELSIRGEVVGYQANVSVYSEVEEVVYAHLSKFKHLDVLINTAAIQGPIGALWGNSPEEWAESISINLVGSFNLCRSVVPWMKKAGNGVIILYGQGWRSTGKGSGTVSVFSKRKTSMPFRQIDTCQ